MSQRLAAFWVAGLFHFQGMTMAKIPSRKFPTTKKKIASRKFPKSQRKIASRKFAKAPAKEKPKPQVLPARPTDEQSRQERLTTLRSQTKALKSASELSGGPDELRSGVVPQPWWFSTAAS